jgi:hypothetical protein
VHQPQLAALGKQQVQAGVQFPAGAAAVGPAANPPTLEQVAAEQAALRVRLSRLLRDSGDTRPAKGLAIFRN